MIGSYKTKYSLVKHVTDIHTKFLLDKRKKQINKDKKKWLAERGFDPRTSGLWAQHASTAPLCSYFLMAYFNYLTWQGHQYIASFKNISSMVYQWSDIVFLSAFPTVIVILKSTINLLCFHFSRILYRCIWYTCWKRFPPYHTKKIIFTA